MRKMTAIFTSILFVFTMFVSAHAINQTEMNIIYDVTSTDGVRTVICKEEIDSDTTCLYTYIDDELDSIVTRTYDISRENFSITKENVNNQEIIITDTYTRSAPDIEPIMPFAHGVIAETIMGTVHYISSGVNLGARLSYSSTYTTEVEYEKPTTATNIAAFILEFAGLGNVSDASVAAFVESAAMGWFADVAGDVILWFTTEPLEATFYNHTVWGVDLRDDNNETVLTGESFYVTEEGLSNGQNFKYGYTPYDWGTGYLGSKVFYDLFGVNYTPTSWQEAA